MADESLVALADVLQVLANPARLSLLNTLQRPAAIADLTVPPSRTDAGLARDRAISRQSLERHLDILAGAGLVTWREADGKRRRAKEYVLNHARLFAAIEELRALTRLRATISAPDVTIALDDAPLVDPESVAGPRLVVVRGVPEGDILPLEGKEAVLGREETADLRLDHDPFVSANHCRFLQADGGYLIGDSGDSRNGTTVNGRRLAAGEQHPLQRGNLVGVGRSLLLYLD